MGGIEDMLAVGVREGRRGGTLRVGEGKGREVGAGYGGGRLGVGEAGERMG